MRTRSNRFRRLLGATDLLVLALALAWMTGLLAAPAARAEDGEQTLTGEWVWSEGDRGDLRAVFTAADADSWEVDFYFEFRGKPHVYSGTAQGSLSAGELSGRVQDESKRRTWVFSGRFDDGGFRGEHSEVFGETTRRTGTLSLGR